MIDHISKCYDTVLTKIDTCGRIVCVCLQSLGEFSKLVMVPFHPVKITRVSRNISYHLYHNFAQSQSISSIVLAADHDETNDSYPKPLPQHQRNSQEWAKLISTQVSNCTNLKQLNHYYAHIIRTQLLSFYDAPFYWNNVIRSILFYP